MSEIKHRVGPCGGADKATGCNCPVASGPDRPRSEIGGTNATSMLSDEVFTEQKLLGYDTRGELYEVVNSGPVPEETVAYYAEIFPDTIYFAHEGPTSDPGWNPVDATVACDWCGECQWCAGLGRTGEDRAKFQDAWDEHARDIAEPLLLAVDESGNPISDFGDSELNAIVADFRRLYVGRDEHDDDHLGIDGEIDLKMNRIVPIRQRLDAYIDRHDRERWAVLEANEERLRLTRSDEGQQTPPMLPHIHGALAMRDAIVELEAATPTLSATPASAPVFVGGPSMYSEEADRMVIERTIAIEKEAASGEFSPAMMREMVAVHVEEITAKHPELFDTEPREWMLDKINAAMSRHGYAELDRLPGL